jgi:acyl-CoA thioesterase
VAIGVRPFTKFYVIPGDATACIASRLEGLNGERLAMVTGELDGDGAQALADRLVAGMRSRDRFSAWLGIEVVALAPGTCTVRMTVRPDMLNGFDVCHGGVTFSLADSAFAFASNTHGRLSMSVENCISYLAPIAAGDVLMASAREEDAGPRLARYHVTVKKQDDTKVAIFHGTVYRTQRQLYSRGGEPAE